MVFFETFGVNTLQMEIAWRWGHAYEIKGLGDRNRKLQFARVYVDGHKKHLFEYAEVMEQYKNVILVCQLGFTELISAKVLGFLHNSNGRS